MCRSTDVKESIAGYYYQLLIACRELCALSSITGANHQDSVAIEKGSDVKIFKKGIGETSIEAKFYKVSNFNKKSIPIIHTLYNFHNSFKSGVKSDKYIFSTNVGLHDADSNFFRNWPNKTQDDLTEYLNFVKQCIIRESIRREPFNKNFDDFKKRCKANNLHPDNKRYELSFYTDLLINELFCVGGDLSNFGDIMDDSSLKDFITRINFEFSERKKFEEVLSIKQKIYSYISLIDDELETNDCDIIMNLLLDKFLDTTITEKDVYVLDLLSIIQQYKGDKQSYCNKTIFSDRLTSIMRTIECEIERFDADISDFKLKSKLLENFISITELFYGHMKLLDFNRETINHFIGRYSLDSRDPIIITNLARVASMLIVFGSLDNIKIDFYDEHSVSNIIFNDDNKFCFKESFSRNINTTEQLIHEFISTTLRDLKNINGREVVVFSPPSFRRCKEPCNFKNGELQLMVTKIAQVKDNFNIRALYSGMDYRCIKCLEQEELDEDMFVKVKRFREGCK